MNIKKLIKRRWLKIGYEQRTELVDGSDWGSEDVVMKNTYSPNNDYIGNFRMARFLFYKKGIRFVEKVKPEHCVCSIGFNPEQQKWYGWSHRSIVGFGIGDRIFEENYGNDDTLFIKHGRKTIKTLVDAKQAACNFAEFVS